MTATSFPVGRMARAPEEAADLRTRVDQGVISAMEAVQSAIINPLSLNKAKRRKKRVTPPKQINMFEGLLS